MKKERKSRNSDRHEIQNDNKYFASVFQTEHTMYIHVQYMNMWIATNVSVTTLRPIEMDLFDFEIKQKKTQDQPASNNKTAQHFE